MKTSQRIRGAWIFKISNNFRIVFDIRFAPCCHYSNLLKTQKLWISSSSELHGSKMWHNSKRQHLAVFAHVNLIFPDRIDCQHTAKAHARWYTNGHQEPLHGHCALAVRKTKCGAMRHHAAHQYIYTRCSRQLAMNLTDSDPLVLNHHARTHRSGLTYSRRGDAVGRICCCGYF